MLKRVRPAAITWIYLPSAPLSPAELDSEHGLHMLMHHAGALMLSTHALYEHGAGKGQQQAMKPDNSGAREC